MNEHLVKFIELCLVDGVISDKEREVIFRKSKELGIPEDECEIILEGMMIKYSKNNEKKDSRKKEQNFFEEEKVLLINELQVKKTSDETLKNIFESNYLEEINYVGTLKNQINTEIPHIDNKIKDLDEKLKGCDSKIRELQNKSKNLINETEFDVTGFKIELKKIINNSFNKKDKFLIDFIDEHRIKLFESKKGFFGKKSKGNLKSFSWFGFIKRNEVDSNYFLNKNDIELINEIKIIYNRYQSQIKNQDEDFDKKIEENRKLLEVLFKEENVITNKKDDFLKRKISLSKKTNEFGNKIQRINKVNNSTNFNLFKKLYNDSPILFQSNIFSRYLQTIEIKNDKQIENLTRFLNFIIEKENKYSKKISFSFEKLEKGELSEIDLNKLISIKDNLKLFYNSFHIMYQGLVSNKMGLFMKVYVELESLGIFNTFFEENVMKNLNMMNKHLEHLNSTLNVVSNEMSRMNNYLSLLNTKMYELKISVDETNLNLMDISSSIQDGNSLLQQGNEFLNGINSGIGLNNILTGIQTYQLYKIGKNTRSLRE